MKNMKQNTKYFLWFIAILVVMGGIVWLNQANVISPTEAQKYNNYVSYVSVPTFGQLVCEKTDTLEYYPTANYELFGSEKKFTCQGFKGSSLVQECDVYFKMPDTKPSVLSAPNAYLMYSVCDVTGYCDPKAAQYIRLNDILPFSDTKPAGYNTPAIHITTSQYIIAEYREINAIGSISRPTKVGYKVAFYPWYVVRHDVFSLQSEDKIGERDCIIPSNLNELNFKIKNILGSDKLATTAPESTALNSVNIQARGAKITYLSNFVAAPAYGNVNEEKMEYCKDKQIYKIIEIETPSGTYKMVDMSLSNSVRKVDCCDKGDVTPNEACINNKIVPLSTNTNCQLTTDCQAFAYSRVTDTSYAYQTCENRLCVNKVITVKCTSDSACNGGRCIVDIINPSNNKCDYTTPNTCGNNVCEASKGETLTSCQLDCYVPPVKKDYTLLIAIIIGAVLLLIIILLLTAKKKGGKK